MLRTIMIFPEFDNMDIIDDIRARFDPLAHAVRPHITLVFPFDSAMSNTELEQIIRERLASVKPFFLRLGGFSKQIDSFGFILFLDVLEGAEEIRRINRLFYDHEFRQYDAGFPYIPHITVGKLSSAEQLDLAFDALQRLDDSFSTEVRKISVEEIGPNEESIIVLEYDLHE